MGLLTGAINSIFFKQNILLEVERIQKRALRIMLLGQSYKEAIKYLGCPRLDQRHDELCVKTMKKI